jgi:hypothetical protein
MTRIVLVPGCWALLPRFASSIDPVADLRAACDKALSWLGEAPEIVADGVGHEVAAALLDARTTSSTEAGRSVLVVANGSACRTEKAPGHLDPRAEGFDQLIGTALRTPDPGALRAVDATLAAELWADTAVLPALADLLDGARTLDVGYDAVPYGVQYWVVRWEAR